MLSCRMNGKVEPEPTMVSGSWKDYVKWLLLMLCLDEDSNALDLILASWYTLSRRSHAEIVVSLQIYHDNAYLSRQCMWGQIRQASDCLQESEQEQKYLGLHGKNFALSAYAILLSTLAAPPCTEQMGSNTDIFTINLNSNLVLKIVKKSERRIL